MIELLTDVCLNKYNYKMYCYYLLNYFINNMLITCTNNSIRKFKYISTRLSQKYHPRHSIVFLE